MVTAGERLILLYQYLMKNGGKDRPITRQEIFQELARYDIEISPNTFRQDMYTLKHSYVKMDWTFDKHAGNRGSGGYRITTPFEISDLQLIIDCIQSSKFITQRSADILCAKVKSLVGSKRKHELNRPVIVHNRIKSKNDSVVKDSSRIYEAISNNQKIQFRYFHRVPDKRNPRSYSKGGGIIKVSPYNLQWNNGNYYLYAYDGSKFVTYRVDRMDTISHPIPEPREGMEEYKKLNAAARPATVFDMYHGKTMQVRFRCHNMITDAIIDRFGDETVLISDDPTHFTFTATIEESPPFYAWVATLGKRIRILSPVEAVDGMKAFLNKSLSVYED